jgi:hypothetical protein
MKLYESHYEEYISSVELYNLHPELLPVYQKFPKRITQLENLIIYGPAGVGKYSQVLYLLKKYSQSELKYDKKIIANTEKQQYIYRISDIHYEIDMSLLGCNSKMLWHEIFFQIVDIIAVKPEKFGIILCKNFHLIHTELLEIFYSYMQQYNHSQTNIKIKFFLLTEHISFLPSSIVNSSHILNIKRPTKDQYETLANINCKQSENDTNKPSFSQRISECKHNQLGPFINDKKKRKIRTLFQDIELDGIMNIKELRSFSLIDTSEEMPKDIFNIICNNIITEITNIDKLNFASFRDTLYDILTYNLEMTDCIWYILRHFIKTADLSINDTSDILKYTFSFFKYYNNNYRPIYHLESIMFYIINKIHKFNEL